MKCVIETFFLYGRYLRTTKWDISPFCVYSSWTFTTNDIKFTDVRQVAKNAFWETCNYCN